MASDLNAGTATSKNVSGLRSLGSFVGGASTESYSRRRFVSVSVSSASCRFLNRASIFSLSSSLALATPHLSGCSHSDRRLYSSRICFSVAR
eukprot:31195-Pelagococcus_subviridis.AAC.8